MKNIVLIGMSGVGKTTVGESLSQELELDFVDTDELIESKINMTIEQIFSTYGEDYFRELELGMIDKLSQEENLIISTGGGIVLNSKNVINLRKNGILILLDSSIGNIVNNLESSTNVRPLLNKDCDMYIMVKSLYESRKELYLSSADFIISVDNKSKDDIVYEILKMYAKINY